jgi:hypothetical protein
MGQLRGPHKKGSDPFVEGLHGPRSRRMRPAIALVPAVEIAQALSRTAAAEPDRSPFGTCRRPQSVRRRRTGRGDSTLSRADTIPYLPGEAPATRRCTGIGSVQRTFLRRARRASPQLQRLLPRARRRNAYSLCNGARTQSVTEKVIPYVVC